MHASDVDRSRQTQDISAGDGLTERVSTPAGVPSQGATVPREASER